MEENGEDSHAMQTEENTEELKDSHDAEEGAELEDVQKNGKASSKKRGKKKVSSGVQVTPKKPETKEPITPASDRPARERKSIDRFADTVEKEKEKPKEFKIEQGAGTCLRDIPNVVFKLSKRKTSDESVQLLHKLLYSKRVKPHYVKSNILQFSGCVWGPNEEKEKSKMKEKLEKCVKDNLCQLSDLLDLKNVTKTTKKEDVVLRVLEFLDCPHKTTEILVQEEEQKLREKKRKKTPSKGKRKKSSGQKPRKRQKLEANEDLEQGVDEEEENEDAHEEPKEEPEEEPEEVPVKKKKSIKIKEPSRDAKPSSAKKQAKKSAKKLSESEDGEENPEEPAEEPEEPEEAPEEPKRKRSKNKKYEDDVAPKSPKKAVQKSDVTSKSPKKGAQKSVKKKSVYEPGDEDLDDEVKDVKSKPLSKVSKKPPSKEALTPVVSPSKEKKKAGTGSTKASSKKKNKEEQEEDAPPKVPKKARGASNSDAKEEIKSNSIPQDEDLRAAICELLRDADFSTVTFTDVVKQLGAKFDVDLSQNKAHVKNLIQEEISKIVDEDEDDGEGDNEDEEAGIHTPEKKEKESITED